MTDLVQLTYWDETTQTEKDCYPVVAEQASRNIGEIISSTLPLTDAGLHLLDGTRLSGDGIYKDFVDYVADLYNDAKVYNPSAFTVVGSPNITDDGIASGFSINDYLSIPSFDNTKPFSIIIKIKTPINLDTSTDEYFLCSNGRGFIIGFDYGLLHIWATSDGGAWDIANISGSLLNPNTEYFIKFNWNGTEYKVEYSINGIDYTTDITVNSTNSIYEFNEIMIGSWEANPFLGGQIDLKQFSIAVDGVEVFNGSKSANYFCTETEWQQSIADYGVCGKFVYNSVNNTVRLPKITGILEGTTDATALGDLVEAGLPNITGLQNLIWGAVNSTPYSETSALYPDSTIASTGAGGGSASGAGMGFDASRSSSIYGNSTTVQPQTIKAFYYIVIATSTKTDIQVDIDEIATDLNGKADTDLTNVNNAGTSRGASWAMPSNRYIDLTLGASGTHYTAPANGYFYINKVAGSDWYYVRMRNTISDIDLFVDAYRSTPLTAVIPAKKGENVYVYYNATGTTNNFRFIYAQGSESEA